MEKQSKFSTTRLNRKDYEYVGSSDKQSKGARNYSSKKSINSITDNINKNYHLKEKTEKNNVKIARQPKKMFQALNLPKIKNINPRSLMNKIEKLKTFIKEKNIDVAFISESHDR